MTVRRLPFHTLGTAVYFWDCHAPWDWPSTPPPSITETAWSRWRWGSSYFSLSPPLSPPTATAPDRHPVRQWVTVSMHARSKGPTPSTSCLELHRSHSQRLKLVPTQRMNGLVTCPFRTANAAPSPLTLHACTSFYLEPKPVVLCLQQLLSSVAPGTACKNLQRNLLPLIPPPAATHSFYNPPIGVHCHRWPPSRWKQEHLFSRTCYCLPIMLPWE